MSDEYNKPNVSVPLAMSYDTRNVNARTAMQAGTDQRKVNYFYDVVRNGATGNATLELVKRPGVVRTGITGTSGGKQYNIAEVGNLDPWFSTRVNNDNYVCSYSASTVVLTHGTYVPYILSATSVNNTVTVVSQYRTSNRNAAQRVFYASAIGSWTEITDSNFTALYHRGKMEFIDGFALILDSNGGIYNSAINSLSSWPAVNFIKRNTYYDEPYGLARFGPQILAFGANSVEGFVNAGNPTGSPLQRVQGLSRNIGMGQTAYVSTLGLGRTNYYTILGSRMYFVGRDAGGNADNSLFAYDGQNYEKIQSGALSRVLSEISPSNTEPALYSVNKVSFFGKAAVAIQLTPPGTTDQKWLMFFPELNEWFEWESSVFSPVNAAGYFISGGTTLSQYTFSFANVIGTSSNDWRDDYGSTNVAVTGKVQFRLPSDGNNRKFMDWFALEGDTESTTYGVEFSDNDYSSFSTSRNIDMSTQEKRIVRCGSYKNRIVRLTHTANSEGRLRKALARVR